MTDEQKRAASFALKKVELYKEAKDGFFDGWNVGFMTGAMAISIGAYAPWASKEPLSVWIIIPCVIVLAAMAQRSYRKLKRLKDRMDEALRIMEKTGD